jgi:hypothetical protein
MSHQDHNWKQSACHAAHGILHTESGKKAVSIGTAALVAAAPPTLIAAATVVAPVAVIGAALFGLWKLLDD